MQQVERGNPVDLVALKVETVADFDETPDECRFEVRICNVFAGGILSFGRGAEKCSAAGKGLHLFPHGGDGSDVPAGESGAGQPLQFLGQFGALLVVKLLPGSAVFTPIGAQQAGIDGAQDAVGVTDISVEILDRRDLFRIGHRTGVCA